MSVLNKLASVQSIRNDIPNQELARELAAKEDWDGLNEIARNLYNQDKKIQSDCIKVLYETGYIKPELIAGFADDFLRLLKSKNNRMVWGAMIALSVIAGLRADYISDHLEELYDAIEKGSVITVDNGIRALSAAAAQNDTFHKAVFPYLINHIRTCPPKEVALHAEVIMQSVRPGDQYEFAEALKLREPLLGAPQMARVKKIYKALERM